MSVLSKKTLCADDLRRRILTQDLAPGADLDEVALAAQYGMSRPPLREVLSQLSGEGFVVLRANRGAQVAPMTHKTLRNFFVAAPMIYGATTQLAAQHATPAQIMALKDAQLLFRKAIREGNAPERALMNQRFHGIIGDMADNEYLMPSLRRLLIDHTRISMTFYSPRVSELADQRAQAADQHDALIALIEVGDAEGAARLAIDHWDLSRSEMTRFVSPARIDIPLGRALGQPKEAR